MINKCPNCGAEPKEKEIIEFCGLASENAESKEMLKVCVTPDKLKAAIESKFENSDPCLECNHRKVIEKSSGTFAEVEMVKPPTKNTPPLFQETHICWRCSHEYSFINY